MALFLKYNSTTGYVEGIYDDTIHTSIPTPNISITAEQQAAVAAASSAWKVDTGTLELVARTKTTDEKWVEIRARRDALIAATDWTMASDLPIATSCKTDFEAYRQDLRDIPETYSSDPDSVVWPTCPTYTAA